MAGNKNSGRGRPSRYKQIQNGNLLDVCTSWLVENFHTFDHNTKLKVALSIAPKGIQQKVDVTGNLNIGSILTEVSRFEPSAN